MRNFFSCSIVLVTTLRYIDYLPHDLLHLVCSGIPILAVIQNLRWNSNKTSLTSFVSQHTCDSRIFGLIRSKSIINQRHDQILRGPIRATNKRLSHPIQ